MRHLGILITFLGVVASATVGQAQIVRSPEAESAYQAGLEQLEQENWEEAASAFSQAIQSDGTDTEALVGLGDALRELEDYSSAQQAYMDAIVFNDALPRAHYGQGVCFREMNDLGSAFTSFNNAIELDRNDPEINASLGEMIISYNQEDLVNGMRYLDRAIELDPENADAFRNRARGHAMMAETEEAIADLVKSAELDPTAYETYATLAQVHLNEEEYEKAIAAYNQAIGVYKPEESSDPSFFVQGYLEISRTRLTYATQEDTDPLVREELYTQVLADTDKVLEEYPDQMPEAGYALHRRGQALRLQKKYGEAIKAFTEALQLIPGGQDGPYTADAYLKRGICWHYQGQDSLARPDFEQSAAIRFEDPLPHLWLGFSYAQEGDYRLAIDSYGDAVAKSPNFALAYVNRGLAYMQLGEFRKAVDNFNEAIRNEPTEPENYYKRGIAHLKLEEYQKALRFL